MFLTEKYRQAKRNDEAEEDQERDKEQRSEKSHEELRYVCTYNFKEQT